MRTWEDFLRSAEEQYGPIDLDTLSLVSEIVVEIVSRRIQLGWSQAQLAAKAGLKQPAIARLESFAVIPRIDTLAKVLTALNLRLEVCEINPSQFVEPVPVQYEFDETHTVVQSAPTEKEPVADQNVLMTEIECEFLFEFGLAEVA